MKPREVKISGYINVYDGTKWHQQWGELADETLSLRLSETGHNTEPSLTVNVMGMDIRPAIKETGHSLAFQLMETGNTRLLMEPLDITDMGHWISCLFMAIQGVTIEPVQLRKTEISDHSEGMETRKQSVSTNGHHVERKSCLVDVKSIAQMFESMAKKDPSSKLRRTKSSPNLITKSNFSVLSTTRANTENTVEPEKDGNSQEPSSYEQPKENTSPIIVAAIEKTSKEADVKSWQGPYKAQETEKQVLGIVTNPFLAKRRLTKHEQQIQKMEITIKEINTSVERQKNSLAETKAIILELQKKANGTKEHEEITKLENDCTYLQNQIQASEENVERYKALIQTIEDEMVQLTSFVVLEVRDEEHENNNKTTTSAENDHTCEEQENAINGTSASYKTDEEEEKGTKDAPIWAKQAKEKSKKAYKILAEQGKLY